MQVISLGDDVAAAIEVPDPVDHDDDIAGLGGTHDEIGGDVGERAAAKAKAPGGKLKVSFASVVKR